MRSGTVDDYVYYSPDSSLTQVLDLLDDELTTQLVIGRLPSVWNAVRTILLGVLPVVVSTLWVVACSFGGAVACHRLGIPAHPELLVPLCCAVFTVAWFTQGLVGHYNVLLPLAGGIGFAALMLGSVGSFLGILGPAALIAAVRSTRVSAQRL